MNLEQISPYIGYLLGIPFKGLLGGVKQLGYKTREKKNNLTLDSSLVTNTSNISENNELQTVVE